MNLAARLLELRGRHPLQILFARMSLTTALSCLYMWWTSVPDFPLGPRGLRWVLVVRGVTGFFGIYGMWYSMMYLPLAEATVITFLAPMLSGYICDVLLKDPFTRREQLASLVALAGVVFIARPTSLFGNAPAEGTHPQAPHTSDAASTETPAAHPGVGEEPTPAQRLGAILVALLGVLGAAGAFTAIRYIGKRAHPLITVTYFSVWSTLVSATALLVAPLLGIAQDTPPTVGFAGLLPSSAYEWFLLLSLGLCGFVMQFMMTAGVGGERSNRATAMTYTHMLFAAGFDKWVFGHEMPLVSVLGCGLIVGSALWAALGKKEGGGGRRPEEDAERGVGRAGERTPGEEAVPMLDSVEEVVEEGDEGGIPLVAHR
ncbi:uncharacterized protein THITE_2123230 [Thermothielavioides terrestris NRRL 8126]|uniref:EamA domain-containing protein n=1 Tax=Thermothielavioides terrestris (strain ATCC 38088 / NRRL 8126) TaxID=578455 RepID=G2RH09_THETT|nr:uncharacterized protein THITE_2123230 [Thermothielavioides terrestris NRRL 8126]AEO71138.1 hypothetical protein THITE_2123230 [Thermothielavioides terrestris NRRL 8126]